MDVSKPDASHRELVETAAEILRSGGIVAIPTDTLYGLAADAFNDSAVRRILEVKRRPDGMALPLLLSEPDEISQCATDIPEVTWELVDRFWPGGLTLVFKKSDSVSDVVSGGMDTVALRTPDHWVPRTLVELIGSPVTGTSANRSGSPSLTSANAVRLDLGDDVDMVVDIGEDAAGEASTVLDLSGERPRILRTGTVTLAEIAEVCGDSLTI